MTAESCFVTSNGNYYMFLTNTPKAQYVLDDHFREKKKCDLLFFFFFIVIVINGTSVEKKGKTEIGINTLYRNIFSEDRVSAAFINGQSH